jgi:signal transduction histidine kinase
MGAVEIANLWPKIRLRDRFIAVVAAVLLASTTFAYTTLFLQQRALMSAAAGAEAEAALQRLWPSLDAVAEAPESALIPRTAEIANSSDESLVLLRDGSVLWHSRRLEISPSAETSFRNGAREVHLQGSRKTIALKPLGHGLTIGIARPWHQFEGAYSVGGIVILFAVLGVVALGIALVAANDVTAPIKAMRGFARQIERGDLSTPVPVPDPDEVGELGVTLDKMRLALRDQIQAVTTLNQSLERKVEDRTAELRQALDDLHAAQAQMIHTEKIASVGRLAAGVAHEINNPLNFIANSLGPLEATLKDIRTVVKSQAGDLDAPTREKQARELDGSLEDLDELMRLLKNGVHRTQEIVRGLRDFARKDEGEPRRDADLRDLCDQTVALLRHELEGRVEVIRDFDADSRVSCFPGAMGQLLMNLIANAAQAIPGRGTITISSRRSPDGLQLTVRDSGTGIPPDVLSKIFDPFFTTKEVGKGSGLGLSIAHGIVERHGGRLTVESQVGLGTAFHIWLPSAREALARAS